MRAWHGVLAWAVVSVMSVVHPTSARATDGSGQYTIIIGPGADSCSRFLAARGLAHRGDFRAEGDYSMWLAGYLTAFNKLDAGTNDISAHRDMFALLGWLETYCRTNPTAAFTAAVAALTADLYPERSTRGPDKAT